MVNLPVLTPGTLRSGSASKVVKGLTSLGRSRVSSLRCGPLRRFPPVSPGAVVKIAAARAVLTLGSSAPGAPTAELN